jgi:hypothetical protein
VEGFGCTNDTAGGGLDILLFYSWSIILPLISVLFYCRESSALYKYPLELRAKAKIIYVFYRHSRETNQFLHSNGSVNRQNYIRILILACVDIFLTLPIGIITIIGQVITSLLIPNPSPEPHYPFYFGWDFIHSDWDPEALPYSEVVESGRWAVTGLYFQNWISPVLAVTIFALFGITSEARATYWRGICAVGRLVGWEPPMRKQDKIGEIEFGARQITMTQLHVLIFYAKGLQAHGFVADRAQALLLLQSG